MVGGGVDQGATKNGTTIFSSQQDCSQYVSRVHSRLKGYGRNMYVSSHVQFLYTCLHKCATTMTPFYTTSCYSYSSNHKME